MSVLPDRIVVLAILCFIFLTTDLVQGWGHHRNPTVIASKGGARLLDGHGCSGRLQVKINDSWKDVCSKTFTTENALVTCLDFKCGFPKQNDVYRIGFDEVDSWSPIFNCSGQEQQLSACPAAPLDSVFCSHTFLHCSEKPDVLHTSIYSLKGSKSDGDAEVYVDHPFVIRCRTDAPFKVGSFVLRVYMGGNTTERIQPAVDNAALFFFPFQPAIGKHGFSFKCQYNLAIRPQTFFNSHFHRVTVKDASYVRLVGGESRCLGRLELEHGGEWRAVSQQHWGLKEAAVVCRQLDCGSVISSEAQSRGLQPVWSFYSDCDGSERALLACGGVSEGNSVSTVHVLCSDILLPATINVTAEKNSSTVDALVVYSLYSFYITCSVLPQFPGGHFSLVFTGLKRSLTLNQTAANHSAAFTFASAEKAHSGNYSCVYHNAAYGHSFSSQSQKITVVVEDDVQLDDGESQDGSGAVCAGTLLAKDSGETMMVTTRQWDLRHAAIVCRQLGCGSALSTSTTQISEVAPMWRFFSDCNGSEAVLLQCGRVQEWFSSTAIKVVCEG